MWPSFSLFGYFTVYTLPFCVALAFFLGFFVFYRLLHASARYNEFEIFDALVWSSLGGLILGRLFHILTHFPDFTTNYKAWLDIIDYPGVSVFFAAIGAACLFYAYIAHLKIHDLELLDYWVRALCFTLIIYNIGLLLDGSGFGQLVPSFLALPSRHMNINVFPSPLLAGIFLSGVYVFLQYLENNYRTYSWYRGSRSQAKTGFVFFSFWLIYTLFSLFSLLYTPPLYHFSVLPLDGIFYALTLCLIFYLFYHHAFTKPRKVTTRKKK